MKALYDVPAPAKLNLFLHLTGRRPDGYHLLQSVFMLIDWCDSLHFERRDDGTVSREDLSGAKLPEDDLCIRAARALRQATGTGAGAHIAIHKRIPSQAGLGGGSSDAASCLLALNRLWRLGLGLPELEKIGLSLGADVPFFLRGRNAWVEGIGEQIRPIELPREQFVVIKPTEGLATGLIFSDSQLPRPSGTDILSGFAADPWVDFTKNPYGFGRNDLQPVAQRLCPGVTQALRWLEAQGLQGRMTGSGSAVFARLPEGLSLSPPQAGVELRVCGNLEAHPLVGWAPSDDSSASGIGRLPV